ncbi:hypothetical protein VKT23_014362 [Stygiomarasmius scandens]|uniref:Uncharacterized protein n=1 Tax=Marasmiellus scandens TaxID=2682957 RepID=A0ABR1J301_9AGAR
MTMANPVHLTTSPTHTNAARSPPTNPFLGEGSHPLPPRRHNVPSVTPNVHWRNATHKTITASATSLGSGPNRVQYSKGVADRISGTSPREGVSQGSG